MSKMENRDQHIFSIIAHHMLVNLDLPDYKLSEVKDYVLFIFLFPTGLT